MREDALPDGPGPVPKKRRQLERALDVQLALWLDGPLSARDRERVEAERERRKRGRRTVDLAVALVVGQEGATPAQREAIVAALRDLGATEVHHSGSKAAHLSALAVGARSVRHHAEGDKPLVRASAALVAAPKDQRPPTQPRGVWDTVRYARHRGLPVRIVTPDGVTNDGSKGDG